MRLDGGADPDQAPEFCDGPVICFAIAGWLRSDGGFLLAGCSSEDLDVTETLSPVLGEGRWPGVGYGRAEEAISLAVDVQWA